MKKPTLLIKPSAYKTNKLYSVIPADGNGDMTVSGYVGNGTRVNEDGFIETVPTDTPRIDHYGKPGLLLEPTRKNVLSYSTPTAATSWGYSAGVTVTYNDTISPDGGLNAPLIECLSTSLLQDVGYTVGFTDATLSHSVSFFMKFKQGDAISFEMFGNISTNEAIVTINRDGTMSVSLDVNSIITDYYSEKYNDGWIRYTIVYDMDNTDTSGNTSFYSGTSPYSDVTDTVSYWLWGYQVEDGNYSTSLIPTSSVALTRTNDILTLATLISGDLIFNDYHSFYLDVTFENIIRDSGDWLYILGSASEGYQAYYENLTVKDYPQAGSTIGASTYYDLPRSRNKLLYVGNDSTVDLWVNGSSVSTVSSDIDIDTGNLIFSGAGGKWKLHECALFDYPLNDTQAKSITQ